MGSRTRRAFRSFVRSFARNTRWCDTLYDASSSSRIAHRVVVVATHPWFSRVF
jgi:hypothetical protein